MKKYFLVAILFLIVSIGGIIFLSRTISYNQEVNGIEEKIVYFKEENIKFTKQIALASSCEEIFKKAKSKGYIALDLTFQNSVIALKR